MKLLTFTDSVKEPQDAASILAQTTLKLVFLTIYDVLMTILDDCSGLLTIDDDI